MTIFSAVVDELLLLDLKLSVRQICALFFIETLPNLLLAGLDARVQKI